MTIEMIIVLAILAFMVVMLLTRIIPYGVTAMICCVAFVLTGVCDLSTAFSGLSNSTTIMVATMIVVLLERPEKAVERSHTPVSTKATQQIIAVTP